MIEIGEGRCGEEMAPFGDVEGWGVWCHMGRTLLSSDKGQGTRTEGSPCHKRPWDLSA